jgi:hypothetical protein
MEAGEDRVRAELGIATLPDAELLANTRALIGRSNQVLAALLVHLGEVDARGLYRQRACSSLFAYCLYELRLSEDEAVRRVAAARLARKFPELLDAVAAGELHLTGLLLLGPHLTRQNLVDVLARSKHRTKKEIAKLVRILDPLPDVPARIEALGPLHPGVPRTNPTWAEQVASFCPVRELTPGDRPRDWVELDALPALARVNDPRDSVRRRSPRNPQRLQNVGAARRKDRRRHRTVQRGRLVTFRLEFAAPSSSETARAARTRMRPASAAARPVASSSIISSRSLEAASTPSRTLPCAAHLTTPSPPSSTSAPSTSPNSETPAVTALNSASCARRRCD